MNSSQWTKIRKDLEPFKKEFDLILFGSYVKSEDHPKSDIDIAIITYSNDEKHNLAIQKQILGKVDLKYYIRIFELFPIYIQITIIQNYKVIFGDILKISEYFYQFRKRWDDIKYRILSNQFKNYKERLKLRREYLRVSKKNNLIL